MTGLQANNGGLMTQVKLMGEIKKGVDLRLEVVEVDGDIADFFDLLAKSGFGPKLGVPVKGVAQVGLGVAGKASGGGAKYGQCWVFSGTLSSAAKTDGGGVKYGQCWVFGSVLTSNKAGGDSVQQAFDAFMKSSAKGGPTYHGWKWNDGVSSASGNLEPVPMGDGAAAYETVEFTGVQRSENGVIPSSAGLWTWNGGTWSGTSSTTIDGGLAFNIVGGWSFDDSAAQDSSKVAMTSGFAISATGHFVDDWQGETAYLGFDVGSSGTRVSASSSSGKTPDVFAGITFVQPSTGASNVDGVTVCAAAEKEGGEPKCKTGSVADTGSVFRAYRGGGRGVCQMGKCFCLAGTSEGLLRAAGIPTRSLTNFDSAHEKQPFEIPAGVGPSNAFLLRVGSKDKKSGLVWWDIPTYVEAQLKKGANKLVLSHVGTWNEDALKRNGESIWNFHVWNEAWVQAAKGTPTGWNAYDATAQEESDGKVLANIDYVMAGSGGGGEEYVALKEASAATGIPVDVLVEVLKTSATTPNELLHGRWDGNDDDGKQPGTWDGAAKPTPKPGSGSATPADPKDPAEPAAPDAAAPAPKPAPAAAADETP